MAIPKKGSRKIIVNEIEFRWRVRWKPTDSQAVCDSNMTAAIEFYENPQSVLSVEFPWVRYDAWFGVAEQPITPKIIEICIKNALAQGWKPNEKGKTFVIKHENE
jgi:hypothetical protein